MHYAKERDECRAELFPWSQPSTLPWVLEEWDGHRNQAGLCPRVLGRGAHQGIPERHRQGRRAVGWTDRQTGQGVVWVLAHALGKERPCPGTLGSCPGRDRGHPGAPGSVGLQRDAEPGEQGAGSPCSRASPSSACGEPEHHPALCQTPAPCCPQQAAQTECHQGKWTRAQYICIFSLTVCVKRLITDRDRVHGNFC